MKKILTAVLALFAIGMVAQTSNDIPLGLQHKLTLGKEDIRALANLQHKSAPSARTLVKGTGRSTNSKTQKLSSLPSSRRAASKSAYAAADTVFFDSFEDWDGTTWAYINSSNWTRYSNCIDYISEANGDCPAWMAWQTDGDLTPFPSHGLTVAMVMNGYNVWNADSTVLVTPAPDQDEWIVSRLISTKVTASNYLTFDIAYMPYTFYFVETYENGIHDSYIDRDSLVFDVEVLISKNMRTPSNREENYTKVWQASDDVAPLFANLHSGDDISANQELMGFHWHHVRIPLSEFEGSNIRVAFRYKGRNGGTILLDNVRMSDLLPVAGYDIPEGTFYFGMSVDGYYETTSPNALIPAGVKTIWPNCSNADSQSCEWLSWNKGDDCTTGSGATNTRLTTLPTLTAAPNQWGSSMPYPTLTVYAEGGRSNSYSRDGFVKFGGGTELTVDGTTRVYGATNCDLTKQYWTASSGSNYAFGAPSEAIWKNMQAGDAEKLTGKVCGIANLCEKPAVPYTFSKVWVPLSAFSTMTNATTFQCDIHRVTLDDQGNYIMSPDVIASSSCTAKDVKDNYRKLKLYSLIFDFAEAVTVGEPVFIYIHGFENKNVNTLAPYAQAQGHDSGRNYAYLALQREDGTHSVRPLSTLLRNADGKSHAASSFLINIDATFLDITFTEGDIDGDGKVTVSDVTLLIGSYLDGIYSADGDLDSDQLITVADVTSLINLYLDGQ